jgi:hypothetical protein
MPPFPRLALAVLSVLLGAAFCYFMFQAGCAGDLKSGILGDRALALQMESKGVVLGRAAVLVMTVASATRRGDDLMVRSGKAAAALLLGWALMTYLGLSYEVRGVQSCFPPR